MNPAPLNIPNDAPAVFRPRRFTDPVGPLNEAIHDKTRAVSMAIALCDHLGIEVLEALVNNAIGSRNPSVLVRPCRACAKLEGACVSRANGSEKYVASKFGCEITWYQPVEAA